MSVTLLGVLLALRVTGQPVCWQSGDPHCPTAEAASQALLLWPLAPSVAPSPCLWLHPWGAGWVVSECGQGLPPTVIEERSHGRISQRASMLGPWLWGQWPLDLVLPLFGIAFLGGGVPGGVGSHRCPARWGSSLPRGHLTLKGLGTRPPPFLGWQGPTRSPL